MGLGKLILLSGGNGGGPPPPFNPVTGVDGITQQFDGDGAYVVSGNNILSWVNQVTVGDGNYNLGAASPQYTPSYQNGLAAAVFSNSPALTQLNNGNALAQFDASIGFYADFVLKVTDVNLGLFYATHAVSSGQIVGFAVTPNGSYGDILFSFSSDGSISGFKASTPNGFATDLLNITNRLTFTYDGSGLDSSNPAGFAVYLNGVSLPLTTAGPVGSQTGNNTIGGWAVNGNAFNGGMMNVTFAPKSQTLTVFNNMGTYLNNRWAI